MGRENVIAWPDFDGLAQAAVGCKLLPCARGLGITFRQEGKVMAEGEFLGTILRLTLALLAGGLVGLERSYHGRPAGSANIRWSVFHPAC